MCWLFLVLRLDHDVWMGHEYVAHGRYIDQAHLPTLRKNI